MNKKKIVFIVFVALLLQALVVAYALAANDPIGVSFKLEGCKGSDLPDGYDLEANDFICTDEAYTTGNLGKSWNELDLVPHRVTTDAGNSAPTTQTYRIAVVADHLDAGYPGYDVLSEPILNVAKSDPSCSIIVGSETILDPGVGGTDLSLYRLLDITQDKNTTCVFDYYERLAVGSHQFPGASLHSNLLNQELNTGGIGNKDVSIPVNEILPQEISKDMTATQDMDYTWNITKQPMPASVNFGNTCAVDAEFDIPVSVSVEWEILPATPGMVTVITNIYATNPAARTITINVEDVIYGDLGVGQVDLDTAPSGDVQVPPNTSQLVFTHSFDAPANVTDLNDVATASYVDTVTGIPVPGQTTATASAPIQPGNVTNDKATITDVESIDGVGLSYSTDSTEGATGSFQYGYVLGTETTGDVTWISDEQTGNSYVQFNKTLYIPGPIVTSGKLFDTATLTGSDAFTTDAYAEITIIADAQVELTIYKNIPDILQAGETASFDFEVSGPNAYFNTVTISFASGETSKSEVLSGLEPGQYNVHEVPQPYWDNQSDKIVDINLPTCSNSVTFNNTFPPANAKVKKVSIPPGYEDGWVFTLNGPGGPVEVTTINADFIYFPIDLQEGSYTVTETLKDGWELKKVNDVPGETICSFTVDYPADAGKDFECVFTNELLLGRITIIKDSLPPDGTDFEFTSDLGGFILDDADPDDGDAYTDRITFEDLLPGDYDFVEIIPPYWGLTSVVCTGGSSTPITDGVTVHLQPRDDIACTFTNTFNVQTPTIVTTPVPESGIVGIDILNDIAILSGGYNPTGTITFYLYDPNDSSCEGVPVYTETVPVTGNGSYSTTIGYLANMVGTWNWTAEYSGDTYNNPVSHGCGIEQVIIGPEDPTIVTTPDPVEALVGTTLNDSATLSGGYNPTGTIVFKLYNPNDATCSLTPAYVESVTVNGNGTYSTSPGFVSNLAGTWRWTADYSGDANNLPTSSGCDDELVTINKKQPSIVTTPDPVEAVVGAILNDSALLFGGYNPTGTIVFKLYNPNDATCSLTPAYVESVTVNGNGTYTTSPGFVSNLAGTWRWTADYSGDANNLPASSGCDLELVTVIPRGSLEVIKIINWFGGPDSTQSFEICVEGPSGMEPANPNYLDECRLFNSTNGWTYTWTNLYPGVYTVTETDPGTSWTVNIDGSPATVEPGGTATVTVTNSQTYLGYTPGFWKNHTADAKSHHDAWQYTNYSPDQQIDEVFSGAALGEKSKHTGDLLSNNTLLEALRLKGGEGKNGAAEILLRAAVAALLNASFNEVMADEIAALGYGLYPYTVAEVISMTNAALDGSRDDMLSLASEFDSANNGGSEYFDWGWPVP